MWRGNAGTNACVCVQDARIPSQDAAYTSATLDDLCTVCNTCQFIPLRVNYNISRYHTCSHAAHGPNIAFRRVAADMWRGNAGTHACVCVQDARIRSQDPALKYMTPFKFNAALIFMTWFGVRVRESRTHQQHWTTWFAVCKRDNT